MTLTVEAGRIIVPIGKDLSLFAKLRDLHPNAKWLAGRRAWSFPDEPALRDKLSPAPPAEVVDVAPAAPAPDSTSFDAIPWPGMFAPYAHQVRGRSLLIQRPAYMLAWEPGCGKSAPVAAAIRYFRDRGELDRAALIVCPRCVLPVWSRELRAHAGIEGVPVDGPAKKRAAIIAKIKPADVAITTYELAREDDAAWIKLRPCLVVADESHRVKHSTTQSSRALRKISEHATRRWALSGTPAPNCLLDWFGQLLFLGEEHAGTSYWTRFRDRYAVYGNEVAPGVRKVIGYRDTEDLHRRVGAIAHRLKKEDCLDLPPKIYETIPVPLGPKTAKLYRELRKDAIARLESLESITAANVLTEAIRLLQIVGGWVKTDDGTIKPTGDNAKLAALMDIVEGLDEAQAIIWTAFVHEAEAIAKKLGDRATLHHGSVHSQDRAKALAEFVSGDRQFMVATTASLREGVTLTNCSTAIYYSRTYTLTDYLQSQDRCHRIGQKKPVSILHLVAEESIDVKVAKALETKTDVQEMLFKKPEDVL